MVWYYLRTYAILGPLTFSHSFFKWVKLITELLQFTTKKSKSCRFLRIPEKPSVPIAPDKNKEKRQVRVYSTLILVPRPATEPLGPVPSMGTQVLPRRLAVSPGLGPGMSSDVPETLGLCRFASLGLGVSLDTLLGQEPGSCQGGSGKEVFPVFPEQELQDQILR